jgi:hypothetical protein
MRPCLNTWSEHTVNDQCRVRSSWWANAVDVAVVARLAAVFVECIIVLEELEPDEGL